MDQEFDDIKKTKRNRQKTECSVIRSKSGCGICGSENIAEQGVKFCQICGEETDYLIHAGLWSRFWSRKEAVVGCDCTAEFTSRKGKVSYYRKLHWIEVGKCMDCGAVRSNFCPNCKTQMRRLYSCWKSSTGQLYCQRCNFRGTR